MGGGGSKYGQKPGGVSGRAYEGKILLRGICKNNIIVSSGLVKISEPVEKNDMDKDFLSAEIGFYF